MSPELIPATVDVSRPRAETRYRWGVFFFLLTLVAVASAVFLDDYMSLPRAGLLGFAGLLTGIGALVATGMNAFASDEPRQAFVGRQEGRLALMTAPNDTDGAVLLAPLVHSAYRVGAEVVVVARDGSVSCIAAPSDEQAQSILEELFPNKGPVHVPLTRKSKLEASTGLFGLLALLVLFGAVSAAVFGTGLADTLSSVRSEKLGGLGIVGSVVLLCTFGFVARSRRFRPRMAVVGDDAIASDATSAPLTVAEILDARPSPGTPTAPGQGVAFRTATGVVTLPVERREGVGKWVHHLLLLTSAKKAGQGASDRKLYARVSRGARTVDAWRVALDKSASSEGGYRETAIEEALLVEMMEDASVARDAREGAAYLLSKVASERAVALAEEATRGLVVKGDRARIVSAATGRLKG